MILTLTQQLLPVHINTEKYNYQVLCFAYSLLFEIHNTSRNVKRL